jgi:hypothetical protein
LLAALRGLTASYVEHAGEKSSVGDDEGDGADVEQAQRGTST